jgi:hypothetical protein
MKKSSHEKKIPINLLKQTKWRLHNFPFFTEQDKNKCSKVDSSHTETKKIAYALDVSYKAEK